MQLNDGIYLFTCTSSLLRVVFVRSAFHSDVPKNPHSIESTVPSAVVDDDGFLNPNLGVVKLKKYVCM